MAPQEPLFGAPLIARFMAAVARVRPPSGELESRPGAGRRPARTSSRRGPAEQARFAETERCAVEQSLRAMLRAAVDPDGWPRSRSAVGTSPRAGSPARVLERIEHPRLERAHGRCLSRAGSRPCASCAIRTSSAISEVAPGLVTGRPLRCQTCEQSNPIRRISCRLSQSRPSRWNLPRSLAPSSFAFAVRHSGVFWYRGSFSDVTATLREHGDALVLEGSARVDSISVVEPAAMRASVLGPEFFDAERHPEIAFRSTAVRLADDGLAEVDGELTIRGVDAPGQGERSPRIAAADQLRRGRGAAAPHEPRPRQFGFDWQMTLPGGGNAVGWTSRWTSICCSGETQMPGRTAVSRWS